MPTTRIAITLPGDVSYDVRIGVQLIPELGETLSSLHPCEQALIITDSNVARHYLAETNRVLSQHGYKVFDITVPAGEEAKSVECLSEIWEAMAQNRLMRDCVVVALGGGVVGDIAGFAAATYMRGVEVVQVPTTLLSMVDSSVGGKTGINLGSGKNLVGAFKQPLYVCASLDVLKTLPEREWACGCAEIAKSAVIDSDDFFFWLSDASEALSARDEQVVTEAITRSVVFKSNVVARDVTESKGVRECLNYGHTLGHAIETLAGYGTFSHGQAVAEGMRFAVRLGASLVGTPLELVSSQDALLDSLGLPEIAWKAEPQALLDAMSGDKKVKRGKLRFVLPEDVGSWRVVEVENEVVLEHLVSWCNAKTQLMSEG